ncbi:hypothetical protein DH2020_029388 [Rehmannia glutinosa]|uniref:Enoyl reductase (ER) domain-containing protein n=1 Tax=Rehmannia glutinosa TaxID=99300 RepID=A0ABR0VRC8_REHGL
MELKPGLSALVTGGASGIGRALVLALAQKGIFITVVDFSQENGKQVATLAEKEVSKFHGELEFPPVLFIKCDVAVSSELTAAFKKHVQTYGGLDICINCAGIGNPIPFYKDETDGSKSWRRTVDINFVAVIESTRLAIQATQEAKKPGVIINVGSASGLYPMYAEPIYSGSKVVHTLSHNFRSATSVVRAPLRLPLQPDHVLLKIIYAGVNASDVNFSSGRYFSGGKKDIASQLPFDAGFEAVGIIAAIGDSVKHLKVGTPAAIMTFGSYAEFTMVRSKHILPVARPDPEVVAMLTSGLTASIALEKAAQMDSEKSVLVTAAAGGTGQFAVQVLKAEFPKGVDIVYESVGGEMFDLCLNALATYGRLVVIGMISQAGFFLVQYAHLWQEHLDKLVDLYSSKKLKVALDPKPFLGINSVADAVDYLHSGKSVGKFQGISLPSLYT